MDPVEYVEKIPNITQKEAEQILCDNPARLLRLPHSHRPSAGWARRHRRALAGPDTKFLREII